MAAKKDMRRLDLAIPYIDPPKSKDETDMTGTMSSTLPMAAMFTRNRMIGWVSFVFALQSWLGETPDQKETAGTPGYIAWILPANLKGPIEVMALVVTYFPIFMPPTPAGGGAAATPSPSP